MKARPIPTAVHNLPQESLGLSLGGKRTTRTAALSEHCRDPRRGTAPGTHEGVKAALVQLQLLPPQPGKPLPSAKLLGWNLKTMHTIPTSQHAPFQVCPLLVLESRVHSTNMTPPVGMSAAPVAETTSEPSASRCSPIQSVYTQQIFVK